MLRFFEKWIIESQFYVALMGTFFATFFMLREETFNWPIFFLIFITFFGGYSYTEFQYAPFFKKILVLNFLSAFVCIVLLFCEGNAHPFYRWLIICGLGLLYDSIFLRKLNLRKIPFFKIFYVGLVWAMVNGWLVSPRFYWGSFWITFVFITALILPFDIRDMYKDKGKVMTFPLRFGVFKTKMISLFLLLTTGIIAYFFFSSFYLYAYLLTLIVTSLLVLFTRKTFSDFYFSFWIESCSGLPLLFLFLFRLLE